jgi:hydrogenase maturation protease
MTGRAVVIGIGNGWCGDDAAGLLAAEDVRGRLPDLAVVEIDGEPSRLLDNLVGFDRVVVIDAVRSPDAKPGTIHRIDATTDELPETFGASTHHFSLADAVELARSLGRLPQGLVVYGIEGRSFDVGSEPDPVVIEAAAEVARRIVTELEEA